MRSSNKSRSRNKNQNRRPSGNIVNRAFDSSGPEGKVRGTPQQIIEKYQMLTRDAQLSGDRVAAENFQQHAEHYTRLLGEAQREMNARREQQDAEAAARRERQQENNTPESSDPASGDQPDVSSHALEVQDGRSDAGLVQTPEAEAPKPQRRPRKKPQQALDNPSENAADQPVAETNSEKAAE